MLFEDAVNNQNMHTMSRDNRHSALHKRVISSQHQTNYNTLLNSVNADEQEEQERNKVYAEFTDEELKKRELIKTKRSNNNKRLATNYKYRIARFLENMAKQPVIPSDEYQEAVIERKRMLVQGRNKPTFSISGIKTDQDIIKQMKETAELLDITPAMPEVRAWNMRPRVKSSEIGPIFRFGPKMQI